MQNQAATCEILPLVGMFTISEIEKIPADTGGHGAVCRVRMGKTNEAS